MRFNNNLGKYPLDLVLILLHNREVHDPARANQSKGEILPLKKWKCVLQGNSVMRFALVMLVVAWGSGALHAMVPQKKKKPVTLDRLGEESCRKHMALNVRFVSPSSTRAPRRK